jgi:hypothetical protein
MTEQAQQAIHVAGKKQCKFLFIGNMALGNA